MDHRLGQAGPWAGWVRRREPIVMHKRDRPAPGGPCYLPLPVLSSAPVVQAAAAAVQPATISDAHSYTCNTSPCKQQSECQASRAAQWLPATATTSPATRATYGLWTTYLSLTCLSELLLHRPFRDLATRLNKIYNN